LVLVKDLELAGMEAMLDIRNMLGNINKYMEEGLKNSTCAILLLTPRLKERASHAGCNLRKELDHIKEKKKHSTGQTVLIPIMRTGDFSTALPEEFLEDLYLDFVSKETEEDDDQDEIRYFRMISRIESPLGLLASILQLRSINKNYLKWYEAEYFNLEFQLEKLMSSKKGSASTSTSTE